MLSYFRFVLSMYLGYFEHLSFFKLSYNLTAFIIQLYF